MDFPILGTNKTIPWNIICHHEEQALRNHGQTLKRLAERGGCDWVETLAILENRQYKKMNMDTAMVQVLKIVR